MKFIWRQLSETPLELKDVSVEWTEIFRRKWIEKEGRRKEMEMRFEAISDGERRKTIEQTENGRLLRRDDAAQWLHNRKYRCLGKRGLWGKINKKRNKGMEFARRE